MPASASWASEAAMSERNLLACNLGSYGRYRAGAYEHLHSIGVRHVEIGVPPPEQVAAVAAALVDHELTVSTLMVPCDVSADEGWAAFAACLPQVERLGVSTVFVSVKQGQATREEAYARLRRMGEAA